MATATLVKKLDKEVRTLRRDITEIRAVLLSALSIPEESIIEYKNAARIRKAFAKAVKEEVSPGLFCSFEKSSRSFAARCQLAR